MPATIEIPTTRPGRTLTLSAFPDGSDTAAFTEVALTEASNRPGVYSFSNDTATGLHLLIAYDDTTPVWQAWAVLETSGVIVAADSRSEALYLDASVSSRSTFDHVTDKVTVAANEDKTGYGLAADQAVNVTRVNGNAVSSVDDFKIDATGIRSALGMSAANLDSQLDAIGDLIADVDDHLTEQDEAIEGIEGDIAADSAKISDIHGKLPTATYLAGSDNDDGSISVIIGEEAVDDIAIAIRESISETGVGLSDEALARIAGTVIRFVPPAWNGVAWDKPIVIGDSYTGALRLKMHVQDWSGDSPIEDAASITFVGKRNVDGTVVNFSFDVPVEGVSTEAGVTTILIPLTSEQTSSIAAGKYECNLIVKWIDGEEEVFHSLFASGFNQIFRERP